MLLPAFSALLLETFFFKAESNFLPQQPWRGPLVRLFLLPADGLIPDLIDCQPAATWGGDDPHFAAAHSEFPRADPTDRFTP